MSLLFVHECSRPECRAEGIVGLGMRPRWLCLEHFDEEAAEHRKALDAARAVLGGR